MITVECGKCGAQTTQESWRGQESWMEAGRTVWEAEELAGMREGRGFWAKATTDYRGSKTRDMLSSLSIVRGQGTEPHVTGMASTPVPSQGSHSYSATADRGHTST